jgi:hypothetical protein
MKEPWFVVVRCSGATIDKQHFMKPIVMCCLLKSSSFINITYFTVVDDSNEVPGSPSLVGSEGHEVWIANLRILLGAI